MNIRNITASDVRTESQTETDITLSFIFHGKRHLATVSKSLIKDGAVDIKEYHPFPGEKVFLIRRAKQSDWIRSFNKAEHSFLLTKLGQWFEYTGMKEDMYGRKYYKIVIPDSPSGVYEVPSNLILTY